MSEMSYRHALPRLNPEPRVRTSGSAPRVDGRGFTYAGGAAAKDRSRSHKRSVLLLAIALTASPAGDLLIQPAVIASTD
jgi:hypothetical protein